MGYRGTIQVNRLLRTIFLTKPGVRIFKIEALVPLNGIQRMGYRGRKTFDDGPVIRRRANLVAATAIIAALGIDKGGLLIDGGHEPSFAQGLGLLQPGPGQDLDPGLPDHFGQPLFHQAVVAFFTGIGGLAEKIQGLPPDGGIFFHHRHGEPQLAQMVGAGKAGDPAADD
jgi:hypothetical protein